MIPQRLRSDCAAIAQRLRVLSRFISNEHPYCDHGFAIPTSSFNDHLQSLCNRLNFQFKLYCNCSTIVRQLLYNRFANTLYSICIRFVIALRSFCIRFSISSRSLCDRFAITLQSLCGRFAIALNRFAIAQQSLCNRFDRFAIVSQSLCNRVAIVSQ
jgi:hypothetical protein